MDRGDSGSPQFWFKKEGGRALGGDRSSNSTLIPETSCSVAHDKASSAWRTCCLSSIVQRMNELYTQPFRQHGEHGTFYGCFQGFSCCFVSNQSRTTTLSKMKWNTVLNIIPSNNDPTEQVSQV
jgi:hypothetical protein